MLYPTEHSQSNTILPASLISQPTSLDTKPSLLILNHFFSEMFVSTLLPLLLPLFPFLTHPSTVAAAEVTTDYIQTNSCTRKSERGDTIHVHYRGTLAADGSEFDASYNRGQPLRFTVGKGQVIKGWDEGLLDMCPGDKRKLTIPPEFGYGKRGMPPVIPEEATLSELVQFSLSLSSLRCCDLEMCLSGVCDVGWV